RPDADLPAHRDRAGTDRVLDDLPGPGREPAGPTRYRLGLPGSGDRAVLPGVHGYQPDRRAAGGMAGRGGRAADGDLGGLPALAAGRPCRPGGTATETR